MPPRGELANQPADISLSEPKMLAKAYRDYHRYQVTVRSQDAPSFSQERDILIAGKVVVVIPIVRSCLQLREGCYNRCGFPPRIRRVLSTNRPM